MSLNHPKHAPTGSQEQESLHSLSFLSRAAMDFVQIDRETDVYQLIGARLADLVGKVPVIISSFDSRSRSFTLRSFVGPPRLVSAVLQITGRKVEGMVFPLSEAAILHLYARQLEPIPVDLYELTEGTLPAMICRGIESIFNLGAIYAMGFIRGEELFGSASIYLPRGAELNYRATIETFINLASVAIERQRAEDALRRLNAELEQRVIQRTEELRAANERLTELDRLKSKFVADVSHEFRTPAANLKLYLELLDKGRPERRDEYIAVLHQQAQRLVRLLDDILDLTRLEMSEQHAPAFGPVDMRPLVENIVEADRLRAEAVGLTLMLTVEPDLPPVYGEAVQLEHVIMNLLSNAFNFTSSGYIRVSLAVRARQLCLQVEDSGLGIPAKDLPHIFERFFRGRHLHTAEAPGSGLGLAIVKEIVDLHHGCIEVDSRVGIGSTFRVWLPLYAPQV